LKSHCDSRPMPVIECRLPGMSSACAAMRFGAKRHISNRSVFMTAPLRPQHDENDVTSTGEFTIHRSCTIGGQNKCTAVGQKMPMAQKAMPISPKPADTHTSATTPVMTWAEASTMAICTAAEVISKL
jgi:hypothetical protein